MSYEPVLGLWFPALVRTHTHTHTVFLPFSGTMTVAKQSAAVQRLLLVYSVGRGLWVMLSWWICGRSRLSSTRAS